MSLHASPGAPRMSSRAVMAVSIGLLVLVLSLKLGWFGHLWGHVDAGLHETVESVQIPGAPDVAAETADDSQVFVIVETPPRLIGGLAGLQEKLKYPNIAKAAGIEGRVFLQFVVEKSGQVTHIVVTRGIGGGCDEEAVRALGETRFTPGTQDGKRVRVKMSIPVSFRLG